MKSVIGPLWKSLTFILCTVLATSVLAATIRNSSSVDGTPYRLVFSDATSLNKGDDVRIAGVRVGQVTEIEVGKGGVALVTVAVDSSLKLTSDVAAAIRFRNLVGQRYIATAAHHRHRAWSPVVRSGVRSIDASLQEYLCGSSSNSRFPSIEVAEVVCGIQAKDRPKPDGPCE